MNKGDLYNSSLDGTLSGPAILVELVEVIDNDLEYWRVQLFGYPFKSYLTVIQSSDFIMRGNERLKKYHSF